MPTRSGKCSLTSDGSSTLAVAIPATASIVSRRKTRRRVRQHAAAEPETTQTKPPSVTRWIPIARDSRGASAPKVAKASTGIDVSSPVSGTDESEPVADLGQDGTHGDRRRTQVERQRQQPDEDQQPSPGQAGHPAPRRRGRPPDRSHAATSARARRARRGGPKPPTSGAHLPRCERIVVQDEVDPALWLGGRHRQPVVDADDRPRVAQPPVGEQQAEPGSPARRSGRRRRWWAGRARAARP